MSRRRFQAIDPIIAITVVLVVLAVIAACLTVFSPVAGASSGGTSVGGAGSSAKLEKAKLKPNGKAIPPRSAPGRVKRAIRFANRIRKKPYKWGGGHRRWRDKGYDCSGAVSYALHGARMLSAPLASGGLMSWGRRGKGKWITVFANSGHTYAMIAGLRWDTSGTGGKGPRWHKDKRSAAGFKKRHFRRF